MHEVGFIFDKTQLENLPKFILTIFKQNLIELFYFNYQNTMSAVMNLTKSRSFSPIQQLSELYIYNSQ
jgi:hypothetical protein